ncbi:MAG: hypothetical protein ABI868_06405 [Acidobacteriota bacterium]
MTGRSYLRKDLGFFALTVVVTLAGAAGRVDAQDFDPTSPVQPAVRFGPLALAPIFRLTEFGYDSNVYNRAEDNNPAGDFSSRLTPSVDASLRSAHVRIRGRSLVDVYYFKALSDLNSVDSDNVGQVDLAMNRVGLFVNGRRLTTRHRRTLEIDAIARRRNSDLSVGGSVRLTGKTSLEMFVTRARLDYAADSLFLDTNLAQQLNHTAWTQGFALGYAATSLTRFSVEASRTRARFDAEADRDSGEWRVTPTVTFSPLALVTGRASIGYYRRTFSALAPAASSAGGVPSSAAPANLTSAAQTGTSALINLTYTLLGRTRLNIDATRRLEYSYLAVVNDYLQTSITGSVTQRLGESWDVVGRFGRSRLSYQQSDEPNQAALQIPAETVYTSGADLGYNIRHTRLGLYVSQDRRTAAAAALTRGYRRVRIGASATYVF